MDAFVSFMKDFSLVFLALFVVMDPLTLVPFLVSFLDTVPIHRRRSVVYISLATGLAIGLAFLALGRAIFQVLGIGVSDFLIAGGVVLLVFALRDLLREAPEAPAAPNELMAVVPIGTPLLVGPATISMLIVQSGVVSLWPVVVAFLANIVVAWIIFSQAHRIVSFLGKGGLQAFSKVMYLLLAAIAVQLIRRGVTEIIQGTS